jgi:hypothetical protein
LYENILIPDLVNYTQDNSKAETASVRTARHRLLERRINEKVLKNVHKFWVKRKSSPCTGLEKP